ncbi:MAG TPA: hypothetical protein VG965_05365 [Patescibacteria group bacterium]|nr:hypothetical protein [Patescibacteria group bacterium]
MQRQKATNTLTNPKKKYLTQSKIRIALFTNSYANYRIAQVLKRKYKLNGKLTPKELRIKYFNKNAIPEISRLSHTLNLPYKPLWEGIMLDKSSHLDKNVPEKEKIRAYLSIEKELIMLSIEKQAKTSSFFDPDYENEFALLSIAIERAVGNKLVNIEDDSVFNHQQEILQKLYLRWYYRVAWRYKLPTTRIVPFVLRLIS